MSASGFEDDVLIVLITELSSVILVVGPELPITTSGFADDVLDCTELSSVILTTVDGAEIYESTPTVTR